MCLAQLLCYLGVVFLLDALIRGPLLWLGDPGSFPLRDQPHRLHLEPGQLYLNITPQCNRVPVRPVFMSVANSVLLLWRCRKEKRAGN